MGKLGRTIAAVLVAALAMGLLAWSPAAAEDVNAGGPADSDAPAVAGPEAPVDGTTTTSTTAPEVTTTTTVATAPEAELPVEAGVEQGPPEVVEGQDPATDEVPTSEPAPVGAAADPAPELTIEASAAEQGARAAAAAAQLTVVVLMIDITAQARVGDASCGDQNGDGHAQVLDCEIAAAIAVVHALASPDVVFALLLMTEQPFMANFAIGRSTDYFVSITTDVDQNGVPDILEALQSLGGEWEPTGFPPDGSLPDIPAALDLLADLIAYVNGTGHPLPYSTGIGLDEADVAAWRAFLFSSGRSARGPVDLFILDQEATLDGALARLQALGVEVNTFPTGSASTGCGGSLLGVTASRTGGACRTIGSAADARCEARSVALGGSGCGAGSLPRTGGETSPLVVTAAVLLLVGGALLLLARRRAVLVDAEVQR
jgi:LPXTG-motif cell wall-anchored protein